MKLQVYPNPFSTYATLSIKGAVKSISHIIVTEKAGNIIEDHELTGSGTIRLLEKAHAGIYFVKIISGDLVQTRTVSKL